MAIVLIRAVRTKKNANYGVQLFLKRPFRLGCFVLVFFSEIHDVLKFSDIQLGSQGKWNSVLSYHLLLFIGLLFHSILFFFLLFSLFFLLSFFFINYDKVFFFSFHLLLFSFFLVFRTRHGVVNKDLVRDEALRFCLTPPPPPKKCCLTEDDQLGFVGNCPPTPPLSHR